MSASEAATVLHLHPKRVQQLARAGRLPAVRVGRKWLFRRTALEGLLGGPVGEPAGASADPSAAGARTATPSAAIDLSARNQLRVRVIEITVDGLMAELRLGIAGQEIVSVITRSSVARLGIKVGDEVLAVVKSTEVMIGRPGGSVA